jgi:hypothetical protein
MNCVEFTHRMHEVLDERRQALPPALARHAAECAACGRQWRVLRRVARVAAEPADAFVPAVDLADRILRELDLARETAPAAAGRAAAVGGGRSRGASWRRPALSAAVAVAAICWLVRPPAPPGPAPRAVVHNDRAAGVRVSPEDVLQSATAAYSGLASQALDSVKSATRIVELPAPGSLPTSLSPPRFAALEAPTLASAQSVLPEIDEELRPIRNQVEEGFAFLWRSVPGLSPGQ